MMERQMLLWVDTLRLCLIEGLTALSSREPRDASYNLRRHNQDRLCFLLFS